MMDSMRMYFLGWLNICAAGQSTVSLWGNIPAPQIMAKKQK